MNWFTKTVFAAALAAGLALNPLSAWAGPVKSGAEEVVSEAEGALAKKDYARVLDLLGALDGREMENSAKVQVQYLLGSARFGGTNLTLQENREKGLQKRDRLEEHQVTSLKQAFDHFKAAHDMDPEGKYAAECLYMTGRILDWGYLQRFREALDNYKKTYESYPGTEFGEKAGENYKRLLSLLSPHGGGSHGRPGSSSVENPPNSN